MINKHSVRLQILRTTALFRNLLIAIRLIISESTPVAISSKKGRYSLLIILTRTSPDIKGKSTVMLIKKRESLLFIYCSIGWLIG